MKKRPYVLTIAGFDPSGGAGLIADIKTFEALKVYGLSVCTANTIQNDIDFKSCYWVDIEIIKHQIAILFDRFRIDYVKIGIIKNWEILNTIIDLLLRKNAEIKIVLDPVLRSSSNFDFHASDISSSNRDYIENQFEEVLKKNLSVNTKLSGNRKIIHK